MVSNHQWTLKLEAQERFLRKGTDKNIVLGIDFQSGSN